MAPNSKLMCVFITLVHDVTSKTTAIMTHHPIMTTPRFRFLYLKQRPVALTRFLSRQTVLTSLSADFYRQLYITVTCMITVTFKSVKAGLKN